MVSGFPGSSLDADVDHAHLSLYLSPTTRNMVAQQ